MTLTPNTATAAAIETRAARNIASAHRSVETALTLAAGTSPFAGEAAAEARAWMSTAIRRNKRFQDDGWKEAAEILAAGRKAVNQAIRAAK